MFLDKILRVLKKYNMLTPGDSLIVGVSGGIDSVTLLYALNQLKGKLKIHLHVAHFNHQLRGEESFRDSQFVENLAHRLGLPYSWGSGPVEKFARTQRMSLEEAARTLRYQFFYETAKKAGAGKIATAHTADDQAETLLLRLLQGAGLGGLSGIRPVLNYTEDPHKPGFWSGQIIRPLLETPREEVARFARQEKLEYVLDSSNLDKRFLRNKIRLDLLPLLRREFNPQITNRLAVTASLLQEDFHLLNQLTEETYPQVCRRGGQGELWIELDRFTSLPPALQRRVLRKSFEELVGATQGLESDQVQSVVDLLKSKETGKVIHLPKGLRVRKAYGQGIIYKGWEKPALQEQVLEVPGVQSQNGLTFTVQVLSVKEGDVGKLYENLKMRAEKSAFSEGTGFWLGARKNRAQFASEGASKLQIREVLAFFDYDKLRFPLRIRKRKPGDRFQPLGMKGQKKLQDLFVDLKVPREKRDLVPILQDEEGIIWVIGYRQAERVKVEAETQKILVCTATLNQQEGNFNDLPQSFR